MLKKGEIFSLIAFLVVVYSKYHYANAQGLQQLSYANADLGEKLIRSTIPTTVSPTTTTTQKQGLFSGLRSLFSRTTTTTLSPSMTIYAIVQRPIQSSTKRSNPFINTTISQSTIKPTSAPTLSIQFVENKNTSVAINIISVKSPKSPIIASSSPSSALMPTVTLKIPITTSKMTTTVVNLIENLQKQSALPSSSAFVVGRSNKHHTTPFTPKANPVSVSDAELLEFTEELFKNEQNHNLYNQIQVNYQGRTHSATITDDAKEPLLKLNKSILDTVPTIIKMRLLFNNYEQNAAINEHVTSIEKNEEINFADALLATSIMQKAMEFFRSKGKVNADVQSQRDLLKLIWFKLYSRGNGKIGSSGFEHVFLSELKKGDISGLHNWVYFYEEELAGNLNYMGYIKKLPLGDKGTIIKLRFSYNGHIKPTNSVFIGTSPELEFALYTVCFLFRPDGPCPVSLNGHQFIIRTYTFRYRGNNLIGSAFPEI